MGWGQCSCECSCIGMAEDAGQCASCAAGDHHGYESDRFDREWNGDACDFVYGPSERAE